MEALSKGPTKKIKPPITVNPSFIAVSATANRLDKNNLQRVIMSKCRAASKKVNHPTLMAALMQTCSSYGHRYAAMRAAEGISAPIQVVQKLVGHKLEKSQDSYIDNKWAVEIAVVYTDYVHRLPEVTVKDKKITVTASLPSPDGSRKVTATSTATIVNMKDQEKVAGRHYVMIDYDIEKYTPVQDDPVVICSAFNSCESIRSAVTFSAGSNSQRLTRLEDFLVTFGFTDKSKAKATEAGEHCKDEVLRQDHHNKLVKTLPIPKISANSFLTSKKFLDVFGPENTPDDVKKAVRSILEEWMPAMMINAGHLFHLDTDVSPYDCTFPYTGNLMLNLISPHRRMVAQEAKVRPFIIKGQNVSPRLTQIEQQYFNPSDVKIRSGTYRRIELEDIDHPKNGRPRTISDAIVMQQCSEPSENYNDLRPFPILPYPTLTYPTLPYPTLTYLPASTCTDTTLTYPSASIVPFALPPASTCTPPSEVASTDKDILTEFPEDPEPEHDRKRRKSLSDPASSNGCSKRPRRSSVGVSAPTILNGDECRKIHKVLRVGDVIVVKAVADACTFSVSLPGIRRRSKTETFWIGKVTKVSKAAAKSAKSAKATVKWLPGPNTIDLSAVVFSKVPTSELSDLDLDRDCVTLIIRDAPEDVCLDISQPLNAELLRTSGES